jgi:hypothetical protein
MLQQYQNAHIRAAVLETADIVFAPAGTVEPSVREEAKDMYIRCKVALIEDSIDWATHQMPGRGCE